MSDLYAIMLAHAAKASITEASEFTGCPTGENTTTQVNDLGASIKC